jgi:hypothetical protein
MNPTSVPPTERSEFYERRTKLLGGYIAFVAALLVATIAKSIDYPRAWLVISLLAISLPSLVAYTFIDYHVLVVQGRPKSAKRGLAALLAFFPSLAAIAILVGHFSVVAAVLFVLLSMYWPLTIFGVALFGTSDPASEV